MLKTIRNAKGFTLVELAIVLVIIGIILGAVLKGNELITNAKIKRVYGQYREIAAAMYTYMDRYQYFPGDDRQGTTRWTNPPVTSGDGNGFIATGAASTAPTFNCTATGSERCDLWSDLRQSNILSGPAGSESFTNPKHAFGGNIEVTYQTLGAGPTARSRNWIYFQLIPAEVAQIIDQQYDDGVQTTGSIRGTAAYTPGTNVNLAIEL